MALNVLSVASEIFPLIKTGGLADVVGALPKALQPEGMTLRTLVPGYPTVLRNLSTATPVHAFDALFGAPARLLFATSGNLVLYVLEAPHLFDRNGGPYLDSDGIEWPDNAFRFAALAQAAARIGSGVLSDFVPDVVHAHDWQAGLTPAYLRFAGGAGPRTVMTVHNMAYQGRFPAELLPALGLPPESFTISGVEYHGGIGYLKAGLQYADWITTVSPNYALEIMTDEGGMGLGGLLRARAAVVSGILNGIDTEVWDPAADPHLVANYKPSSFVAERARNKAALQSRLGMALDPDSLLLGVVSRLDWQKGLDLLLETLPALQRRGAQLAILGSGDRTMQLRFLSAQQAQPDRIGVTIGYDESLAHQIQGGSDAILAPSRFEPCGLTQLCAMRYGALPVVCRVGGLADTVIDANEMAVAAGVATGVQFHPPSREALTAAIFRTVALWRDKSLWRRLQQNAMATDVSWKRPAGHYATLYRDLVAEHRA